MTICLSHISALQALREARSKGCRPKEAGNRIPKSTSIREVETFVAKAGFLRPLPPEEKISILVSSQSSRSKSTKTVTHVCANNAVATIALAKPRGIFIPNLGFLFVQLAQCAPFLTLMKLGMNYAAATPSCQMRVHLFNASQPPTTTILRKKSGLCEECEDEKSQQEPCNSLRTIPHPPWKPNSPCSFALKEQWAATVYRFLNSIFLSSPPLPRGRRSTNNTTSLTFTGQNAKSMSNTTATATTPLPKESPRTHSVGMPCNSWA